MVNKLLIHILFIIWFAICQSRIRRLNISKSKYKESNLPHGFLAIYYPRAYLKEGIAMGKLIN